MKSAGVLLKAARVALLLLIVFSSTAFAQRLSFIGVALDSETREADRKLQDYLHRRAGVDFSPEELEYGQVVDRVANWKESEGFFVGRMTPYVYVAAEMLGARFETLATYVGAVRHRRTYSSYFVVNRKNFPAQPDLDDFLRFLSASSRRPKFIYHSRFSTSSYFLPSLFLREHSIYSMENSTESMTAISSEQVGGGSSSRLVKLVASGDADFAAVWDGTRNKFEKGGTSGLYEEYGRQVYFIQLPTHLPNDLLVCSSGLDAKTKKALKDAIDGMGPEEIGVGDFQSWTSITEATEARRALADLKWKARERSSPVTVDIQKSGEVEPILMDAVRQALRLAGTELVPYDEDYHQHIDFSWTLSSIHDGAISLKSRLPGTGIDDQIFRISFLDENDLTQRVVSIIHSRLHRIRMVWPYSGEIPTVIRDTAAPLSAGDRVKVQRISWIDPDRNFFRSGPIFDSVITDSGLFRYRLRASDFQKTGFDAMSNVSYRVFLLRSNEEKTIFKVLSAVLLGLFVLAAVAGILDLRRRPAVEMDSEETRMLPSS